MRGHQKTEIYIAFVVGIFLSIIKREGDASRKLEALILYSELRLSLLRTSA